MLKSLKIQKQKVKKYKTKAEAIRVISKEVKKSISKKYLKEFLSGCNIRL